MTTATHLVLIVLDKRRFHHVNTMLTLDFLTIVQKEFLISAQLLLDGLHRDLINCVADLERSHRLKQLFGYVEHILGEKSPL